MKSKLMAATLLAVAVAVSSLTSCTSPTPPPLILVVGDSLTYQSSDKIEARGEDRGYRVVVSSLSGTTIEDSTGNTRNLIEKHEPDAVVVALGTNNEADPNFPGFSRLATQEPFDVQVTNMLAITSAVECSIWMEPTETPASSSTAELTKAKVETLRALVVPAKRIAWNDKQSEEPSPGAWLRADGIHLTPVGEGIYADTMIDETISKCDL